MIDAKEIFALAKTVNMVEYLQQRYALEFNRTNKCCCPFHDEKTPSFSVKELPRGGWHFECFGCGAKGDTVEFVVQHDRISNKLEAAKQVCVDNGLDIGDDTHDEATRIARDEEIKARIAAADARKQEMLQLAEVADAETMARMAKRSEQLFNDALNNKESIRALFPMWGKKLDAWWVTYIGYDDFHQSPAIIIPDETRRPRNIKTRNKWLWNDEEKRHEVGVRNPNLKWGGEYGAKLFPFPLEWFEQHGDETVIVCEGEKDALNLLNLDVRCLTIGAANGDIDPWAEKLTGLDVLIWFDHDVAGYSGAAKHYAAIKPYAKRVRIVSFYHLCNPSKKYDISDYIEAQQITDADTLFEKIAFATFSLNDKLLDIFGDLFPDPNLKRSLEKYKSTSKQLQLDGVLKSIIDTTPRVNGQADEEVDSLEALTRELSNKDLVNNFAAFLGENGGELVEKLREALKKKQTLYNNYRQTHEVDIANTFIRVCRDIGYPLISYHGFLYIWMGTHYYKFKETELQDFIMHRWFYAAKVDVKKQSADMADKLIRNLLYKSYSLEPLREKQDFNVVTFTNGTMLIFENGRTVFKRLHQIEDGSTFALPFEYRAGAKAPKWQKFLRRVLPGRDERLALMEFFGYCFLPSHRFQKFLLMYGQSGSNGKSIVMEVIRMFFGREMIGDLDLQDTEGHQLEALDGKLINIGSEIDATNMDGGQFGKLKKMTAGESVTVNPKQRTPYSIYGKQIPKFIYSANVRPKSGLDAGVFRRMLLLGFTQEIKGDEVILDIQKRFEDELDGIFNLALEGLARLIAHNGFTQSAMMAENIEEYKNEANPILAYLKESLELDKGVMVPGDFLYAHYKAWCEANQHHKLSKIRFSREVREQLDVEATKMRLTHPALQVKEPRVFKGIRMRDDVAFDRFKVDGVEMEAKDCNLDPVAKCVISHEKGGV